MSTPPLLVELECPTCHATHWEIDHDFRASYLCGGVDRDYGERKYSCPRCDRSGTGFRVIQKSPAEFFLQPHDMYPMTTHDFQYWLAVLKEHFPDNTFLNVIGMSWYPGKQRFDHQQRLHRTMHLNPYCYVSFGDDAVANRRLYVTVQQLYPTEGEATFWVEPRIELRQLYYGFSPTDIAELVALIGSHEVAIRKIWARHAEDVLAFQRESLALLEKTEL